MGSLERNSFLKAPAAFGTNWEGKETVFIYIVKYSFLNGEKERGIGGGGGHVYHVFFIATFCFLPVVPELPLGRKTNNKAASHRDERSSQWRETDFYK